MVRSRSGRGNTLLPGLEGTAYRDVLWLSLMSLLLFVLLLPFSSYVAGLTLIREEWGLNNMGAGAIFSAYLVGYAVSALFVIPLTDRLDPKWIFVVATVLSVLTHVLFPLAAYGIVAAVLLRAAAGVGLVGVYMPGLRLIADRFSSRRRGLAMGIYVASFYAANSVSLAATGGLMAVLEWREAFLVLSLASGVSLPLAYFLLRGYRSRSAGQGSGSLDLSVLRNRAARHFILGYSLHAAELYAVRVWLPVFLTTALVSRGIDDERAAVTAAAVGGMVLATGAVAPVMGGAISDRWGRATSASVIFVLSGACSLAFGWMGGLPLWLIVGVGAVYGWAIAADSSIYSTAVTEVSDPAKLGSMMAIQAFLGFMGGVVGPIVVGGVLDVFPESVNWGMSFSLVSLLAVVAVPALMRVRGLPTADIPPLARRERTE